MIVAPPRARAITQKARRNRSSRLFSDQRGSSRGIARTMFRHPLRPMRAMPTRQRRPRITADSKARSDAVADQARRRRRRMDPKARARRRERTAHGRTAAAATAHRMVADASARSCDGRCELHAQILRGEGLFFTSTHFASRDRNGNIQGSRIALGACSSGLLQRCRRAHVERPSVVQNHPIARP